MLAVAAAAAELVARGDYSFPLYLFPTVYLSKWEQEAPEAPGRAWLAARAQPL
jgi:hypothetical protein